MLKILQIRLNFFFVFLHIFKNLIKFVFLLNWFSVLSYNNSLAQTSALSCPPFSSPPQNFVRFTAARFTKFRHLLKFPISLHCAHHSFKSTANWTRFLKFASADAQKCEPQNRTDIFIGYGGAFLRRKTKFMQITPNAGCCIIFCVEFN